MENTMVPGSSMELKTDHHASKHAKEVYFNWSKDMLLHLAQKVRGVEETTSAPPRSLKDAVVSALRKQTEKDLCMRPVRRVIAELALMNARLLAATKDETLRIKELKWSYKSLLQCNHDLSNMCLGDRVILSEFFSVYLPLEEFCSRADAGAIPKVALEMKGFATRMQLLSHTPLIPCDEEMDTKDDLDDEEIEIRDSCSYSWNMLDVIRLADYMMMRDGPVAKIMRSFAGEMDLKGVLGKDGAYTSRALHRAREDYRVRPRGCYAFTAVTVMEDCKRVDVACAEEYLLMLQGIEKQFEGCDDEMGRGEYRSFAIAAAPFVWGWHSGKFPFPFPVFRKLFILWMGPVRGNRLYYAFARLIRHTSKFLQSEGARELVGKFTGQLTVSELFAYPNIPGVPEMKEWEDNEQFTHDHECYPYIWHYSEIIKDMWRLVRAITGSPDTILCHATAYLTWLFDRSHLYAGDTRRPLIAQEVKEPTIMHFARIYPSYTLDDQLVLFPRGTLMAWHDIRRLVLQRLGLPRGDQTKETIEKWFKEVKPDVLDTTPAFDDFASIDFEANRAHSTWYLGEIEPTKNDIVDGIEYVTHNIPQLHAYLTEKPRPPYQLLGDGEEEEEEEEQEEEEDDDEEEEEEDDDDEEEEEEEGEDDDAEEVITFAPKDLEFVPVADEKNDAPFKSTKDKEARVLNAKERDECLVHASGCVKSNCTFRSCSSMKILLRHGSTCPTRAAGGCRICRRIWTLLQIHARQCTASSCQCSVPRCADLRASITRLKENEKKKEEEEGEKNPSKRMAEHDDPPCERGNKNHHKKAKGGE